jgi:hypothetical protein
MKRWLVELLIVFPLALLLAGRGAFAIVTESIWIAPKYGPALNLSGSRAQLTGLGFVGLGFLLLSAWVLARNGWRNSGIAMLLMALTTIVVGFCGAVAF